MTRSPLAYPLNRSADMDAGGAADLQTDIMRFMAILSLCLVAIFALVQSIPITPEQPAEPLPQVDSPPLEPAPQNVGQQNKAPPASPPATPATVAKTITLKRPEWVPKYPQEVVNTTPVEATAEIDTPVPAVSPLPEKALPPPGVPETEGFTLRFESDAALTRLVAASTIGLYAVDKNRARRMTVAESRISFWDASTPNAFHEMEAATVPDAVIEALARTGAVPDGISWGVTLPGSLKSELDRLMTEHRGGALVIAASGDIRWEAT
ncbi:MAG: hypothetical protein WBN90_02670 [Gammaproteobacteria bacterium]